MRRTAIAPVSVADLTSWPTKRLLGLRDRLVRCEASLAGSDIQLPKELATPDPACIHFKEDPRWSELYDGVRRILSTREHVPGGDERAVARREGAKHARSSERTRQPMRRGR